MSETDGSLSVGQRIRKLEEMHEQGGPCETHRCDVWEKLNALTERLTRLEVKLVAVIAVSQVLVTVLVQVALALLK